MSPQQTPAYVTARVLLARGEPLPVDLVAKLIKQGFDVAEMERLHAL